jgi:dephospho-CoA kinase
MLIIGITGTLGAGKGTIVEYLINKKNFSHFSVREFIIEEINKRNMPVNRDSMVVVANSLREQHSSGYIVEQLYERAKTSGQHCIIESVRTPGEIAALKSKGKFFLFAVDALPKIRYERVVQRNSETDQVSFETFIENEQREMHGTDPNKQNIGRCMQMADFVFSNNEDLNTLHKQVDEVINKILNNTSV